MFRSMRITVNGKTYDVTVEETGIGSLPERTPVLSSNVPIHSSSPAVQASVPVAPTAPAVHTASPAPAPRTSRAAGSAGVLKAPIPGTVTSIKVAENQTVSKGDVVLLLEAMKMENEICAHTDGIISHIFVQTGTMVNTGDPLLEIS